MPEIVDAHMKLPVIRVPIWKIISRTFGAFMDNDLTTAAAAVSYFSMLALFPILILLLSLGSQIIGPEAVEKYIINQALQLLPGTHTFVRRNLESLTSISTEIIVSCIAIVLWAASWMFTVIEKALNRIWGTYPRSFLHGRAVNFAVMSLVFALLGVTALLVAIASAIQAATAELPLMLGPSISALSGYFWQLIFMAGSLILTVVLFTIVYKWLPNAAVSLQEAITGATVAGVMWEIAKYTFAYLIPYFHYDLLYGSIGAGVALLTWVYLSSLIMLLGAEFTALLHREHLFKMSQGKTQTEEDVSVMMSE